MLDSTSCEIYRCAVDCRSFGVVDEKTRHCAASILKPKTSFVHWFILEKLLVDFFLLTKL